MKIPMFKRVRIFGLVVSCGLIGSLSVASSQNTSFITWLCHKLKIDPGVYARVTRDIPRVRSGDQIVSFDKKTGVETLVWSCGGCWSPTLLDSKTIAVIKENGIWTFTIGQADSNQKVLEAGHIQWILGPVDQPPQSLLVAASQVQNGCILTLQYARLSERKILPVEDSGATCLDNAGNLIRSGQVMGDRLVHSSANGADILIMQNPDTPGGKVADALFDWRLNSAKDGIARFDPQWINATTILYLKQSLRF